MTASWLEKNIRYTNSADRGGQRERAEHRDRPELGAQRARAAGGDRLAREHGDDRHGRDDRERHPRPVGVVGEQDDRGDGEGQREREAQGEKRYPTPHTVSIQRGVSGSVSSLARSRRMCTVTVDVSV